MNDHTLRAKTYWQITKYASDRDYLDGRPYEIAGLDGNILVNVGINEVWDRICGATSTAFSEANSTIGVGDSTTAADATQTDLQAATNKLRRVMDSSYPTSGTSQKATWKSTFTGDDANWAWNEFAVFNVTATTGGQMLNRKVSSQGTKVAGQTWTVSVEITLS